MSYKQQSFWNRRIMTLYYMGYEVMNETTFFDWSG